MIFVENMRYADVGKFGCRDIPTPNIDALAREVVRFTNASCTGAWCVPSRAGLLTGCFPGRLAPRGVQRVSLGPQQHQRPLHAAKPGRAYRRQEGCS
ncbi:MAG: sulfatase-like hydrolase/transferase [Planctomycetaceae bacterium]|nr:sulfatase-like hydrolase/transferase [Planctomycetaceae bacterium]